MTRPTPPVRGCPMCGGQSGVQFTLTESHAMGGRWGQVPQAGDSGLKVRCSLVACVDCGHRFRAQTLEALGAMARPGPADCPTRVL
ncbi:hypothetical protein PSm6_44260 [Pseudomonas solani]|uniref:Uncharacterized protein n=1 Tax=Pseudomonas solani TaxID=2731552 RepID=A0ABM7LEE5_9PSED|nr:hypothetical protein PSm6_44260 [Pseudomonas solani]